MSSTTADKPLAGRTAVVTGASRGIGQATAKTLHAAGAQLIVVARDLEAMQRELVSVLGQQGAPVHAIRCDFSDPGSIESALQRVRELSGAPDIIVNNAGQFLLAPIERTSVNDFDRTLVVNLTSQFAFIREFIGDMRARSSGHIVTIGSIADHRAFPENAAYAASKFGSRGLHEVLREELRGSGVRATLISPGPVDTTLWDEINPDERPGFTPRAEMLDAEAVAQAVRFVVTQPADVNVDEMRLSHS